MIRPGLAAPFRYLGIAALVPALTAAVAAAQPGSSVRILDVPYIEQSEALCGGAAAAMVMRYWGARGVSAESFAPLVDAAAGGIRAERLLADLTGRGWDARSFRGDAALVTARLAAGQPVVALIEDRPGAYHFVVVVAWAGDRVVYHDPAKTPFRVVSASAFQQAWQQSDRWTMLLLPGEHVDGTGDSTATAPGAPPIAAPAACDGLMASGTRSAREGVLDVALATFASAAELCPHASAPHREAAGVHALEGRWTEAARHARAAVERDRRDDHAWRILAASTYLSGDLLGALDAWNAVGEPTIDLLRVDGLGRTRHAAVTRLIGLEADSVLTASALQAAEKRLRELPSAELGRIRYTPLGEGRTEVSAAVFERPQWPTSRGSLARIGLLALTDRELAVDVASPTGGGDAIAASWRWWENRPRLELGYATPSRVGIWRAAIYGEEQAYSRDTVDLVERRTGGGISLANWTPSLLRWEAGVALDSWHDGRTGTLRIAVDQRAWEDRLALTADLDLLAGAFTAGRGSLGVSLRTRTRNEGRVVLASGGVELASAGAPLALWSGAGSGPARHPLLRGHALLKNGRITGDVFGRRLLHATGEVRRWSAPWLEVLRIAPAVFLDAARAAERLEPGAAWQIDAGAGLRLALPGGGVLRVDVGKGLRDGSTALSVAFVR